MECIFCRIVAGEIPAEVVTREPQVVAFLDVQPLADGHVLVVPRAHVGCVEDLGLERVHGLGRLRLEADTDERADGASERVEVDFGVEAPDDAALLE